MEMYSNSRSTMYKVLRIIVLMVGAFLFHGCEKTQLAENKSGIDGVIVVGGASYEVPNGVKVTLTNQADNSIHHIAVSDYNGKFIFRDIDAGSYIVDAVKQGYRWGLMIDDGVMNPYDRVIELTENTIKNLRIQLWGDDYGTSDAFDLDITDMKGEPLTKIVIPKDATTVSFRLFNGTQKVHGWEIWYNLVSVGAERVFTSFNISDGILEPGDNVVLVGYINSNIFDADINHISGTVSFVDLGSGSRAIKDIEVCFTN